MRTPATVHGAPSVTVKDVSAVEPAQNELFDRIYRAAAAAGARFSPRLGGTPEAKEAEGQPLSGERCRAGPGDDRSSNHLGDAKSINGLET